MTKLLLWIQKQIDRLGVKHPVLAQFLSFALVGGVVTVVDFAVFALCRYLIYTAWLDRPFSFWLLDYPVENGGLCALLAFITSFAVAQIVSFLMQRKVTFHADNNPFWGAVMFTVMILFIFAMNLYVPTLTTPLLSKWLSPGLAATVAKCMNMTMSMLIEFPIDKFLIMRHTGKNEKKQP